MISESFTQPLAEKGRVLVSATGEASEIEEPNLAYLTFEVLAVKASAIKIIDAKLIDSDGFLIPYVVDQPIEVKEKAPTL